VVVLGVVGLGKEGLRRDRKAGSPGTDFLFSFSACGVALLRSLLHEKL
jgi:hypothetical protein